MLVDKLSERACTLPRKVFGFVGRQSLFARHRGAGGASCWLRLPAPTAPESRQRRRCVRRLQSPRVHRVDADVGAVGGVIVGALIRPGWPALQPSENRTLAPLQAT